MNHTRFPKEDHLPDYASRDNQVKKGDRVDHGRLKHVNLLILVSMAVKDNNAFTNLVTVCLYWLTTCFGQLYDHHQVYKS